MYARNFVFGPYYCLSPITDSTTYFNKKGVGVWEWGILFNHCHDAIVLTSLSSHSFFSCDFDLSDLFFFVPTAMYRYPEYLQAGFLLEMIKWKKLTDRLSIHIETGCFKYLFQGSLKYVIYWHELTIFLVIAKCFYCFRNCQIAANARLIPGNNFLPYYELEPFNVKWQCLFHFRHITDRVWPSSVWENTQKLWLPFPTGWLKTQSRHSYWPV